MEKNYPIYKQKFTYTFKLPSSPIDITIPFTILSKRELLDIENMYSGKLKQYKLVEYSIDKNYKKYIELFSDGQLDELYKLIISKSMINSKDTILFEELFWLQQDEQLQSETWDCDYCKERNMLYSRNCPLYLKEEQYDKNLVMVFNGKEYKTCPIAMFVKNKTLLSNTYLAYQLYNKGVLPEQGGFIDQTLFFTEFSVLVSNLVEKAKQKSLEKQKKKNK